MDRADKDSLVRTIGWRERIDLIDLNVSGVEAKIDTGATSCALHAFFIRELDLDGEPHVEFTLHPNRNAHHPEVLCRAPMVGERIVRSSNGSEEERPVIATRIRLGGEVHEIELTLTNREAMEYRMLIGRDLLRGRYLVDADASYICGQ